MSIKYLDIHNLSKKQKDYFDIYFGIIKDYLKLGTSQCEIIWDRSKFKIVQGIRQSGKSSIIIASAALNAMLIQEKNIFIVTVNDHMAKSIVDNIKELYTSLPNNFFKPGIIRWCGNILEFDNRSKITVAPIYKANSYTCGENIDVMLMDEVAFYSKQDLENFWEHNVLYGCEVILLSTRRNRSKKNFFWNLWLNSQSGKSDFKPFKLSIKDCPHITKARLKEIRKNMSMTSYDREFTIRSK